MTHYRIALCLILFSFTLCRAQTRDSIVELRNKRTLALIQWFHDRSTDNSLLNTATEQELRDTGRYEAGVKTGWWKEYAIDTSMMGLQMNVQFGHRTTQLTFSVTLILDEGNYINGKKEGLWTSYTSDHVEAPFNWLRKSEANYKSGLKDGREILYQGYVDQTPLIIKTWSGGKELGPGEVYDANSPYKLRQQYIHGFAATSVIANYYPSGRLQATYTDTFVNGQPLKFMQEFFANGTLSKTGYYSNGTTQEGQWTVYYSNGNKQEIANYKDGKLDGSDVYFHDNGQLWTERIFSEGKLVEVTCNFNRNGQPCFIGTLQRGNGVVIFYDEQGNYTETILYENGDEIRSSKIN